MLDEFMLEQKLAYKVLKNQIIKNKNNHAYLFETNGYINSEKFIMAFAKALLCPNKYTNNTVCENCTQCTNINKKVFSEIKIITPDGFNIKKEQLEELQKEFSKKSVFSNNKIYIIYNAEKLNKAASNSILKFLEEPEENIIAILVTENMYQLLDTIISRCQVMTLSKLNVLRNLPFEEKMKSLFHNQLQEINEELLIEKIKNAIDFINYLEKNKLGAILNTQKMWHANFSDKNTILVAIETIILYYRDILRYKLNKNYEIFDQYEEDIIEISKNNSINCLCNKMNIVNNFKEKVKVNMNNNLLIDKLIIELDRSESSGK